MWMGHQGMWGPDLGSTMQAWALEAVPNSWPLFLSPGPEEQGAEMGAWTDVLWDVSLHPYCEAAPPPSCLSLQSSSGSSSVKCSVVCGLAGLGARHKLGQLDITGLEGL